MSWPPKKNKWKNLRQDFLQKCVYDTLQYIEGVYDKECQHDKKSEFQILKHMRGKQWSLLCILAYKNHISVVSCRRLSQVIGRQAHISGSLGAQNNDSQWGSNTVSRQAHILGSLGAQKHDSQWDSNTVYRQANFKSSPGANKAKPSSFDLLVTTCFTCRVESFTTSALVR